MRQFLIIICCMLGMLQAQAQTAPAYKDFQDGVMKFLEEEGYVPSVSTNNAAQIEFKREGNKYFIWFSGSNPCYMSIQRYSYDFSADNLEAMIDACNYANSNVRAGRAYLKGNNAQFRCDIYCQTLDGFRNIFYKSMRAVDNVRKTCLDHYNKNKKD